MFSLEDGNTSVLLSLFFTLTLQENCDLVLEMKIEIITTSIG